MELYGIEVVAMHSGAPRTTIIGYCGCIRVYRYDIAVHIIEILPVEHLRYGAVGSRNGYCVPAGMRYLEIMLGGYEASYVRVKYPEAVNISLLGMAAHQLLSDTYA